jgi:nitronate monooxygenase
MTCIELMDLAVTHGISPWTFRGRVLLPIVQGGMGVGVSASRLAGTVASYGGVGTISSVDLRRRHPDLWEATRLLPQTESSKAAIDEANLTALDREIQAAKKIAAGQGLIAVNIMKALSAYKAYVRQSLESGADAIVVGAGLPLDLPELAEGYPNTALIPILSDARGIQLIVKKWEKKGRLPDAIVIEHPQYAGGHLGAARISDVSDARFDFARVIPETLSFLKDLGLENRIPLIAAGGIRTHEDIVRLQALGAAAVQLGTAFAVTEECDAHAEFKAVLASAKAEDLVEFQSVAGLPARAVRTPWLDKYLRLESKLKAIAHPKKICNMAFDCLAHCGLRDGKEDMGQFCIDQQLGHALDGDVQRGLFFRGAGALPFGQEIRPVSELLEVLLGGPRLAIPSH